MQNFLGLQFFAHDLVKFLELSMFTNASLPYVHYLMKWIRDHLLHTTYIVFYKRLLRMT